MKCHNKCLGFLFLIISAPAITNENTSISPALIGSGGEPPPEEIPIFIDGFEALDIVFITSFSADPVSMYVGEDTTISWTTIDAIDCTPSGGVEAWNTLDISLPDGSVGITISTEGNFEFVLDCVGNSNSEASSSLMVDVTIAPDADNDRLPDSVETNTGIYLGAHDTGTDPNDPDTDGDGLDDGDEVLGTTAGLDLPGLGTSPLRRNLLLEYDWFDDAVNCSGHSHRPTTTIISLVQDGFLNAGTPNPDGSSGITIIQDYGQGGPFTGGNLIEDEDGVIDGGVSDIDYQTYKSVNFAAKRNGYFHYVLMPHRYNTSSSSSGQAEVPGDDMIVSLQCHSSSNVIANTIVHELGHNLSLRHGGNEGCNYKPNYNSVMNYRYQFPGVDDNCTPPADGVLDYSHGVRIELDENSLDENNGTCGPGFPWDWDGSGALENPVAFDINTYSSQVSACGGTMTTLTDYDDWGNLYFLGINDADGAMRVPKIIITDQEVPIEFQ